MNKTVTFIGALQPRYQRWTLTWHRLIDNSEIKGEVSRKTIAYDHLVYAVGAEVQTFNIPGVKEHACFMKELADAEKVRTCDVL